MKLPSFRSFRLSSLIPANEIAVDYANRREAFGKVLVDHEGVGFMLAENLIDLKHNMSSVNSSVPTIGLNK